MTRRGARWAARRPARAGRLLGSSLVAAAVSAAGLAAGLAAAGLTAPPAAAQSSAEDSGLALTVHHLPGSLSPGGDVEIRTRVRNRSGEDADGLRVVGTVHSAVASRFAFQNAVDDGRLGTVLDGFSTQIDELADGRSTEVVHRGSAAALGLRRADQFGVYPLRLQLLDRGEVLDEVRTALIFTGEQVEERVRAALLVPVTAPPLLDDDLTYDRATLLGELGRAGRAQGLVGSLAAREQFPATLAPDGLLLDEAADLAGGGFAVSDGRDGDEPVVVAAEDHLATQARRLLERLAAVAARRQVDVLALPYGRADLGALVAGGMEGEVTRHIDEARDSLVDIAGADPLEGGLWATDALNAATLAVLTAADVDAVVLSERHLEIPDGRDLSPSPVRRLGRVRGRAPALLVPDPWLEDLLARDSSPDGVAVTVQRVLAETAAVYFERPFAADVRGLLLAPPQDWSPPRGLAAALMDALDAAPWLRPVSLSQLARTVEPEADPVVLDYDSAARARELSSSYIGALADARRSLGSLAGVLATDDADTPTRFDRLLLAAASVDFRTEPAQGQALIDTVAGTVSELYSAVSIVDGPQVWMDAEGPVPVTVANDAAVPLRVQVRLQSQRFIFGEEPIGQPPDERGGWVIPPGETRTLTYQASAVTPGGRAPVSVLVTDVDGVLVLAEDTLVIRSTAVSVAALIVTGTAALFLLAWLIGQVARRRREPGEPPDDHAGANAVRPTTQAGTPERR